MIFIFVRWSQIELVLDKGALALAGMDGYTSEEDVVGRCRSERRGVVG